MVRERLAWMPLGIARLEPKTAKPIRLRDAEDALAEWRKINELMRKYADAHARKGGLTGPQLTVLEALSGDHELSIADLSRTLGLHRTTVADIVKRLERHRVAVRLPSAHDRRETLVSITKEGQRALKEHEVVWPEAALAEQMSRLPLGQLRGILVGLQYLHTFLEAVNGSRRAGL